jgi:hypothetical protein
MAIATGLTAVAIGTAAVGTGLQVRGQMISGKASRAAEASRKQQMNLEADRSRRQTIREAIVARSTALANATQQGAQESSGLEGGIAQVTGQMNQNILAVNQNQQIGNRIFDANMEYSRGQSLSNLGGSLQGLSGQITNNMPALTRIGNFAMRRQYP